MPVEFIAIEQTNMPLSDASMGSFERLNSGIAVVCGVLKESCQVDTFINLFWIRYISCHDLSKQFFVA